MESQAVSISSRFSLRSPLQRSRWLNGQTIAVGFLTLLLIWLIMVPLTVVIWGAFRDGQPGQAGTYTLSKFVEAYQDTLVQTVGNTLVFALGASLLCLLIGTFLAWVTERTDAPLRSIIYAISLFPLIAPGILMASAWVLVLHPKIGIVNVAAGSLLGIEGPLFNGYSMAGMIWAQAIDQVSLPFLLMAAAFRSMDPSLEEASSVSGARMGTTMRRVTLPLLLPAVLAVFLLVFVRAIESFDVPAVLGVPAGIPVFATQVFLAVWDVPQDYNVASAFGVGYLAISLLLLYLYHRATRMSERYVTVTGKAFRPRRMQLGGWRWPVTLFTLLILTLGLGLPVFLFVWTSFTKFYQIPSLSQISHFTLDNYREILELPNTLQAIYNTLLVGIASSLIIILLAAVISWIVIRTRIPGRKFLDFLSFSPIAIPGTVMGLALLWLYLVVPIPIYATIWILIVAFIGKYITVAVRSTHASLQQISVELEEVSTVSGASWGRTFRSVVMPLMAPGLVVAFIYSLSLTFKVLSMPILLGNVDTKLMSVMIYNLYEDGQYPVLSAMGVILLVLVLSLSLAGAYVGRRFGHFVAEEKIGEGAMGKVY
ncbi:MAG: iron ABC transporter permease, partial [Deltaproteobacteria bacterium]|nr:iron ABC transporter permease [Deltaproteobacteria bacterium]